MSLRDQLKSTIDIQKRDGTTITGVKAAVTNNKIIVLGSEILIESGDQIINRMSNGASDLYEVIDPCFNEGLDRIPASYQMLVKKLGIPSLEKNVLSNTFHIHGSQNRINQNSTDNSINIIKSENLELSKLVQELKSLIANEPSIDEAIRVESIEVVEAIDEQVNSQKPNKTIIKSLLNSLPHIEKVTDLASKIMALVSLVSVGI